MYIGNTPAEKYQTLQKQSFTTSATDTYTLDYAVTNPQDLALFLNNVRQNPNDAYSVSNTTLTLSSAITSSDTMYAIFLGRAVETVAPAIGSVTNSMLANSSVTVNGTSIALGASGTISAGITEADQWRLTTNASGNHTPLNANLSRVDKFGTGMTESSGIFTFPSTGYWWIRFQARFIGDGDLTKYLEGKIQTTTDNSSYSDASICSVASSDFGSGNIELSSSADFLFDVTNTTTHKVRFSVNMHAPIFWYAHGSSSVNLTSMTFIRLGDT